jgi:hypothetical protein
MIWSFFGRAEAGQIDEPRPQRYVWTIQLSEKVKGVTRGHRHLMVEYAVTKEGAKLQALDRVRRISGKHLTEEDIVHVGGGTRKA